jgi:hypothetical protein
LGRTGEKSCSAGNFGLAELGVCALSKTYLEQLAIDELISRTSFRAPTLNPITAPGVLPIGRPLRRGLQSRCSAIAMSRPDPEHGHLGRAAALQTATQLAAAYDARRRLLPPTARSVQQPGVPADGPVALARTNLVQCRCW